MRERARILARSTTPEGWMGFMPEPRDLEADIERAAKVADGLAEAVGKGPRHATMAARRLSDEELTLGLAFLARVMEIAAMSSRALADVERERQRQNTKLRLN
jgi:hypothetical protein